MHEPLSACFFLAIHGALCLMCQGAVAVEGEAVLWKPRMPRPTASYAPADRSEGGEEAFLELAGPGGEALVGAILAHL